MTTDVDLLGVWMGNWLEIAGTVAICWFIGSKEGTEWIAGKLLALYPNVNHTYLGRIDDSLASYKQEGWL